VTVEAVIFDWGGTITPWHQIDLRQQWLAYTEVYDPSRAGELADRLLAAEDDAWVLTRDHHQSGRLSEIFEAAGVTPSGPLHERALAAYESGWDPHTDADPDAVPLFRELRARGLRIGILSNTMWTREHHERIFARDGLLELIDGAVYSSEIPTTKPHAQAFEVAMQAVGVVDPSRAVFVGDRLFEDIHGAQTAGMRAVHIPHSDIPQAQRGHTEGEPDAVISSLLELLDHVDRWSVG